MASSVAPQRVAQQQRDAQRSGGPPRSGPRGAPAGDAGVRARPHRTPVIVGSVVLLVLLAAGVAFLVFWIHSQAYAFTDDASIEGAQVSVSSRITGRIVSVAAEEGDRVEAGQLLVQLDDADLRAQEAQATAALNQAKLALNLAAVNLERARNDFRRASALPRSSLSEEQFDHSAKARDAAEAQYAIAAAQIETARAQLGVIEVQLRSTRITAPISGVVAKRSYDPGEVVQPGQSVLLINDLSRLWIVANYEETVIRKIRRDSPARIKVDAYPDLKLEGRVTRVAASIVPPPFSIGESTKTTRKIPVRVEFDGLPDGIMLVPGMSVEVTISIGPHGGR